ncbi:MAG TPA: Gfo/Idh/MocA family oxidoreductase [Thermomicrobiales bacterium]|nr:Gfo/Idh/MocA family oxidoreductase [Thermomicrobiales bacterium]
MTTETAPRPIRLGIIGTGLAVEQLHWPALKQLPERFQIVAFANDGRANAERFAAYSGVSLDRYFADYHALLQRDDVEAVLISLPIPLNYPATRDALAAGKHVFCEKPAGVDEAEARQFLQLAAEFPRQVILIAENFFYRDDLRLARSLLDAGALGRLHFMSWRIVSRLVPAPGRFSSTPWRQRPGYRGGAHLDGGVHHIAQIRLLCGDVRQVAAEIQDANTTLDAPCDLTLNLQFASGAAGNYTALYPELPVPPEPNEMRLYGADAVLALANRRVALYRPDGTVETHTFDGIDGGYYNEFYNFYDAVRHGEPVVGTIAQTVQNMLIVLRGLDAAESERTVTLDDAPGGLSASSVPLWRPRGAAGLFDGLPGTRAVERGDWR